MPSLIRWAIEADSKIGSYYDYERKVTTLEIVDCKAELPLDAVHILSIILGEYECDCDLFFDTNFNINESIIDMSISDTETIKNIFYWSDSNKFVISDLFWEIQNNNIVFRSNLDEEIITIMYLGYTLDQDGLPLVNENNIDAITSYMKLKLLQSESWMLMKKGVLSNAIEQRVALVKSETHRAIKSARAESATPTDAQRRAMAGLFNNPISGYGSYLINYF